MQASCKISYSVILSVEHLETGLDTFFENFETPVEILKDPSCWISVQEMEDFLSEIKIFLKLQAGENYFREIGQNNFKLRAWGILDSVLKMLESPREIFFQPDRFLSYFLSPHPQLKTEILENNKIQFCLNQELKAPFIFFYLLGALEGLPNYMGLKSARINKVDDLCFQILWFDQQQGQSLFDEHEKKRRQFHPEIVKSVIQSLQQRNQTNPAPSDQQIIYKAFEKMVAVEVEKRMVHWVEKQKNRDKSLFKIKDNFYKMYDYFTRAQQIITLISPSARKASAREVMRRVDWNYVQENFPKIVESTCDCILSIQGHSGKKRVPDV